VGVDRAGAQRKAELNSPGDVFDHEPSVNLACIVSQRLDALEIALDEEFPFVLGRVVVEMEVDPFCPN